MLFSEETKSLESEFEVPLSWVRSSAFVTVAGIPLIRHVAGFAEAMQKVADLDD